MRQQSFLRRVWLDITEREKSHPIIYMTKIGNVSDANAMRLTRPCPSAVLAAEQGGEHRQAVEEGMWWHWLGMHG